MRVEKSVFISYRRTNKYIALNVFQHLRAHGYDVFFDYQSLDSGSFERMILGEIKARAHFLIVLMPDTLLRCNTPGDWVRRELELAIDEKRNVVPLTFEGFNWADARPYLTGKIALLQAYQALSVPVDYFDEAMERLISRFLNKPLDLVLHPVPEAQQVEAKQQIAAADAAPAVTEKQITAAEYIARGNIAYYRGDLDIAIDEYTEAIRLDPKYADAYHNRGLAHTGKGDYGRAIIDYTIAIRLDSKYASAYNNRGAAHFYKGDLDKAIVDYTAAITLDPTHASSYNNRGAARYEKGDFDGAISDYTEAIRLNPYDASGYNNRGAALYDKRQHKQAIADYSEAIRLNPKDSAAYYNRGLARQAKGDRRGADNDFAEARRLSPAVRT